MATTFQQGDRIRFDLKGKLVDGWYVAQFGTNVSTVTVEPPQEWWRDVHGHPMPLVYTREDSSIKPAVDA